MGEAGTRPGAHGGVLTARALGAVRPGPRAPRAAMEGWPLEDAVSGLGTQRSPFPARAPDRASDSPVRNAPATGRSSVQTEDGPARSVSETLRGLPLFAGLSDDALRAVAVRTITRRLPKNATLFRRGEPCHGLYIVVEGRIQVHRANPDGREQVLHVQGPGEPVAEVPLFDGGPYPASARALEDSRVLFLPRDAFQQLYREDPEIADAVIRNLGARLRRMVALIAKITLKDVRARVAATLVELAEAEGELRTGGRFTLPCTQEQLARELATTREGVARALAALRRDGIIAQAGRQVEILDVARLDAAAQGTHER
jgi:CRP-like cAMP-binding protein